MRGGIACVIFALACQNGPQFVRRVREVACTPCDEAKEEGLRLWLCVFTAGYSRERP
jgi:hypothetical protein